MVMNKQLGYESNKIDAYLDHSRHTDGISTHLNAQMDSQIAAQRAQRLDVLSVASGGRSKTAQLRDVFDSVEHAIRAGVRYAAIIQDLAETGLVFTYQTFALTVKRLRRERGIVARSRTSRLEIGPQVDEAPNPAATRAPAFAAASEPVTHAAPTLPTGRERRPIESIGAKLPHDWLTAELTREQKRLLTSSQRSARAEAVVKSLWPNPYDPVPRKTTPSKIASQ
ncbi:hypothetical protein [Paraburkholderia humisilvae]|uniref:Uncharacterized protein n=2 Tax=Paraburkholderia humisilvae TaxID=627669 RepID=A0A6J5F468_9BURK|nr:hypothetical protein LMG29542_06799 [Paraburkholderia humisilvae]